MLTRVLLHDGFHRSLINIVYLRVALCYTWHGSSHGYTKIVANISSFYFSLSVSFLCRQQVPTKLR